MSDLKATCYPTDYALDHFVSQDLSKLTVCNAPEVSTRFPQSSHWIGNFRLNSMFGRPVGMDARKFCLAFLRRAEAAFFNYEPTGRRARARCHWEGLHGGAAKPTGPAIVAWRALRPRREGSRASCARILQNRGFRHRLDARFQSLGRL
jgi:hypothetical protein